MPGLRAVRRVVAACVLVAAVAGCSDAGSPDSTPSTSPTPSATPLAERDLAGVRLSRDAFCGNLAETAAGAAVGGAVSSSREQVSGDRVAVAPGVRDVVHENSCAYVGADGDEARAWVFAPPVTPAAARSLVREASSAKGCRVPEPSPAFGKPSVALVCRSGSTTTVSYRGLFGDAWLTCSLTAPGRVTEELTSRAEQWCGEVVDAAAG